MRSLLTKVVIAAALISAPMMKAQSSSSMTGVVTDASGAVVPGATITLTNPGTGVKFVATTDGNGSYRFPIVPPQSGYNVSVSHSGFADTSVKDLTLQISITRTQNVVLAVGAIQNVEVSGSNHEVTLNTTDATIGNVIDVAQVNELPVQDRSSIQVLFALQPGVSATGSVTGARSDQNEVTLDGMDINDIAAGQAQSVGSTFNTVGGAPPDAVQEFRGIVAGLPSQSSTGSGGQFQLITKSGSNHFHGNLNEYHRDNSTTANLFFNKNQAVPLVLPKLVRNQFGGSIGGPVIIPKIFNGHDRLFFFFDFNDGRTRQQSSTSRTVPLDSFRNGNLGYINNGPGCTANSRQNTQAACISFLSSAQLATTGPTGSTAGNYDPQNIGFDVPLLAYVNSRYPHASDLTLGDGVNTGGFRFQQATPQNLYNYVGRIDFNITPRERVFLQYHTIRTDGVQAFNEFPSDPLTFPNQNRSYGYVASLVSEIGHNKINQFYYGDNIQIAKFPVNFSPTGNTSFGFSPVSAPNGSLSAQNRRIPIPEVRDDFNWTLGKHTLAVGGTFKFIKTNSRLTNDYEFVTVGIGGLTPALDSTMRPSNLFANATIQGRYDNNYSFALGRIASESRNYNYDNTGAALPEGTGAIRRYRYFQTEVYAGDTWKASESLTLTYGVRYQYYSVPFEAQGNQSNINMGFDSYIASRMTQSANGLSGNLVVPFFSYNLGGKANNASDIYHPSYKDLAPRFGFSFNPASHRRTVLNGSFGLDFDRTVINAVNFVQDQLSYLFQNSQVKSYGQTNARAAIASDPRVGTNGTSLTYPAVPGPAPLAKPYTPYVTAAQVPTGINTGNVNYAVDQNLKTPYSIAFNLGVQQQLHGGFILSANYVGRLGRRLIGQADASQLIDFRDNNSGQMMGQAFTNYTQNLRSIANFTGSRAQCNTVTPQLWFENQMSSNLGYASKTAALCAYTGATEGVIGDFADSIDFLQSNSLIGKNVGLPAQFAANTFITNKGYSAYHGGLLTLTKNTSYGLQFQANYTFSHSNDNVSAVSNYIGLNTGTGQVCDAIIRSSCYGNSDFDLRHNLVSTFLYELPVGRGRTFGSHMNRLLDLAVGGWSVSGIPIWRSGLAWTAYTGAYGAGYANNIPAVFNGNKAAIKGRLHKTSGGNYNFFDNPTAAAGAFSNPVAFQYGARNQLHGPTNFFFDAGLAKRFHITPERVSFQLRGDGFNVLNHAAFSNPSSTNVNTPGDANFGTVTTVNASGGQANRVIQISGRIEF